MLRHVCSDIQCQMATQIAQTNANIGGNYICLNIISQYMHPIIIIYLISYNIFVDYWSWHIESLLQHLVLNILLNPSVDSPLVNLVLTVLTVIGIESSSLSTVHLQAIHPPLGVAHTVHTQPRVTPTLI